MPKYSIIIPLYNRPDELQELLSTLVQQTYKDFEVLIVEDGSDIDGREVVRSFESILDISYHFKENGGQGFARNHGYERAKGEYLIVFDSDCLIPPHYLACVDAFLQENQVDAFGGPDASHPSFTAIQKAISHTMTSFFTTGGIRGNKTHVGTYHPRSFNMGISRNVYEKTKGYVIPFMGEDMEFSTRILKMGFKTALINDAFVYHKRRTDPRKFYKQLKYFGRARINLSRFHEGQVGIIHLFPTVFTLGLIFSLIAVIALVEPYRYVLVGCYAFYFILIMVESLIKNKSIKVALITPLMTMLQMTGYGYGLIYEWVRKMRGINPNTKYIELY